MRTLVERQREADTLLAYAAEAVERRGRFIGLGAEAGGGKTALVTHVAGVVASQLDVRWGIADSVIAAAPLGAVLDAFPEIEQELQGASGAQRLRVYRTIRSALARQPTLLILEDVHWADDATLDFLRFIARRLHDLPLLAGGHLSKRGGRASAGSGPVGRDLRPARRRTDDLALALGGRRG